MDITLSLALPSEALSVPVIRRVLGDALGTMGVDDVCVGDIQVAAAEACTNVLDHTNPADDYEVVAAIDGASCVLKVIDHGGGFDADAADSGSGGEDANAEHGRGIGLMRALVDDVCFERHPDHGTVVCLRKQLRWRRDGMVPATRARSSREAGARA